MIISLARQTITARITALVIFFLFSSLFIFFFIYLIPAIFCLLSLLISFIFSLSLSLPLSFSLLFFQLLNYFRYCYSEHHRLSGLKCAASAVSILRSSLFRGVRSSHKSASILTVRRRDRVEHAEHLCAYFRWLVRQTYWSLLIRACRR